MFVARLQRALAWLMFASVVCVVSVAAPSFAEEVVKIPETAAEHEALAKSYKDQAVQYRKSEAEHKQMAVEYAKKHPDTKAGANPWAQKMSKHCEMLAKDFEKLAIDATKAADYHTMRAKELTGG